MGNCGSMTEEEKEQSKINRDINTYIKKSQRKLKEEKKLLLLGKKRSYILYHFKFLFFS